MVRALEYTLKFLIVACILAMVAMQTIGLPRLAYETSWFPDGYGMPWAPTSVLVVAILILLAAQVAVACIWPLLTRVRRGTVFTPSSFQWVTVIIACAFVIAGLILLMLGLIFFIYRSLSVTIETAVVLGTAMLTAMFAAMICALAIALLMLVMKALLARAAAQSAELEQVV